MRITLEQFCEQWAPKGNGRYLPNKMEFNTHDFVTMAGEYSKSRFRTSFAEGGLYGSGKLWPERKSRWGRRFTHPVMKIPVICPALFSGRRSAWTAPTLPSVRMANGKRFSAVGLVMPSGPRQAIITSMGSAALPKVTQPCTTPTRLWGSIPSISTAVGDPSTGSLSALARN